MESSDNPATLSKFLFLSKKLKWTLSMNTTETDFIYRRREWLGISEQYFAFVLDHLQGDRFENFKSIVATMNMFPEYICKTIASTYKDRLSSADYSISFRSVLLTGQFYRLRTLQIDQVNSIIPLKSTVAFCMLRMFKSPPDRLLDNLLYALRQCTGGDINMFCVALYESMFWKQRYTRDVDFSPVYFRIPTTIVINDVEQCELMRTRTSINCHHIRSAFGQELQTIFQYATFHEFHYVYDNNNNNNPRSFKEGEWIFKGDVVFLPGTKNSGIAGTETYAKEALFYKLLTKITHTQHENGKHYIFNHVPTSAKLLKNRFSVSAYDSTPTPPPPDFVQTFDLTTEQKSTVGFIKNCEKQTFRDVLSYKLDCDDGKSVVVCSPYFNNAVTRVDKTDWDQCENLAGGIIANETGSGKTLCVIASCSSGTSLIVVPDHLTLHWMTEIKKHTTLQTTECSDATKYALVFERAKNIPVKRSCTNQPALVVISFSSFRSKRWKSWSEDIVFDRVFLEEAHTVNRTSSTFEILKNDTKTAFIWAITATPHKNFTTILQIIRFEKFLNGLGVNSNTLQRSIPVFQFFSISTRTDLGFVKVNTNLVYAETTPEENTFFCNLREKIRDIHTMTQHKQIGIQRVFRILERVSAGGRVNAKLMYRIIERCLTKKRNRTESYLHDPVQTQSKGFMKATDECTVCMERFSEPLQLRCGHVFCKICILAMVDLKMNKCAVCRATWDFPMVTYFPAWAQLTDTCPQVDSAETSLKEYYSILEGDDDVESEDTVELTGKYKAFEQQLQIFISNKTPDQKLVIYTKRHRPAKMYLDKLRSTHLSMLVAGVEGVTKSQSVANIETFKHGKHDVLFMNIKYSNGFDLPLVSHLWIMDYDLNLAKMEQCRGRCVRLGQKHPNINIAVFLYKNSFDDFLYHNQDVGTITCTPMNCILLEYYFFNNEPRTIFEQVKRLGHLVFGNTNDLIITAQPRTLTINHIIKVDIVRGTVNGGQHTLHTLLSYTNNHSVFNSWRHANSRAIASQ